MTRKTDPTKEQFAAYGKAFDYFNRALFDNELPRCILNFSRHARAQGFFSPERWARSETETTHEISLNPDCLHLPLKAAMDTLVHEMAHLWQHAYGKPSRRGYHNAEWADKMESIGLIPSNTGQPGGKRTGQAMSDYPVDGGPFDVAFQAMPEEYAIPWRSGGLKKRPANPVQDKVKYTCPECGVNAWGKPDLSLICGECAVALITGITATKAS